MISVRREPAAPSTIPCEALRSAAVQGGVPALATLGTAVTAAGVATATDGVAGGAVRGPVVGPVVDVVGTDGVGDMQAATKPATMRPSSAATGTVRCPRRSIMAAEE
jgi:hypothetical protein